MPVLHREGIERLVWHAGQGHAIFLVTGTSLPLAQAVALGLVLRLAVRGVATSIGVCATRLEERDGCWTGRIVGEAIFGEAKARAVRRIAREKGFDLRRSYAYGDAASDRWILETVGQSFAVNPSRDLETIARRHNWSILSWGKREREPAEKARMSQRSIEAVARPGNLE
jgi:phosphoserine phosphatase